MLSGKQLAHKYPDRVFWYSFFVLNFLLFLPIYFFFRATASFWPLNLSTEVNLRSLIETLFLQRANPDIFRLNFEFTLLVFLWVFVRIVRGRFYFWLACSLYLAQLSYAVYEGFVRSYYLLDPVFYNDFPLFTDGARYVVQSLGVSPLLYLGGLLVLTVVFGLVVFLNGLLLDTAVPEKLSRTSRWTLAGLTLAALGPLLLFKVGAGWPETEVSSFTAKIIQNVNLSQAARVESGRFDRQNLAPYYQFTANDLREKPDIYLIFVESYGSILYKRRDLREPYEMLLTLLEYRLDNADWSAASTRSNSPTWGGGSWLAYTSALSGLRLDSHAEYLALFNQYQTEPFPHLINYLRSQGYRSVWLSSTSDELNEVEWARYQNFYGVDDWLRFDDLQYDGPLYGWGPAPPDQYVVNYAYEMIRETAVSPTIFFYTTQNSHYPWTPLPQFARDWRALNEAVPPADEAAEYLSPPELRQAYGASIFYELESLVDWIVKQGDDNDIFVLIGDHQPARVAGYEDGWDTPLHVISRDPALIAAFKADGFVPGLNTREVEPTLHHEGLYPLLLRALLGQYGADPANAPAYLPEGIAVK